MSAAGETFNIDLDALVRICQGAVSDNSDIFERELRDCGIPSALRGYVMRQVETGTHAYDIHVGCRATEEVLDAYDNGFREGKAAVLGQISKLADEAKQEGQAA